MATANVIKELEMSEDQYYAASQWQLMRQRFFKHKMAVVSGIVIICFYLVGLFCGFLSPYAADTHDSQKPYAPPTKIHFIDQDGNFHLRPFVYPYKKGFDFATYTYVYTEDTSQRLPIYFIIRGDNYKFLGLFETNIHLFGIEKSKIYLFGADKMGRDVFSRVLHGTRISTSIGLIGVILSFILGLTIGGFSGYYGGIFDTVVQRCIEFLRSIPTIPLWMALSAALPDDWSPIKIYFGITIILSLIGWTSLARVVRGKFLSLREEDFVIAARLSGISEWKIIGQHLIPSFLSHIIASITLAIPGMILAETALSFLGLGLRPPVVSWGVLLQQAQNLESLDLAPWLLLPSLFVVIAVLAFNFLGDGLRDAADPYQQM